jgi:hypothetical protein
MIPSIHHFGLGLLFSFAITSFVTAEEKRVWPFNPLQKPDIPEKSLGLSDNPIDRFLGHRLEEIGAALNEPADRGTWLRRVSIDLTGLSPTIEELDRFLSDISPLADQRAVNRLLASPRYGERWARHWLDVVRYAESAGFKSDQIREDAFKYRDYVISAFNDDLPYDRFVRQQLAGDELEAENPQALIATGMNRLYPEETQASNFKQARQDILDEVTEVSAFAFMGLTLGCAKCHDHKFDPLKQTDFYRWQAFFTPMLPRNDLVVATPHEQATYATQYSAWETATAAIRDELEELLTDVEVRARNEALLPLDQETQIALSVPDPQRSCLQKQLASLAEYTVRKRLNRAWKQLPHEQKQRYETLTAQLKRFDEIKPPPLPTAMALTDGDDEAPPTFVNATGNYAKPLFEVQPGFPEVLADRDAWIERPTTRPESSGRRSALARWLTQPQHPLTARVFINRIWQHHFGVGIVATANDFGAMGAGATHPELLDWLACEFISHGWQVKPIHRLMVLSRAYRQSPHIDPIHNAHHAKGMVNDPRNHRLWHFPRQRLDGEALRDTLLALAGRLNERMYGKSARPILPESLRDHRDAWTPDAIIGDSQRRSIYVLAARNLRYPLFDIFDGPDSLSSCAERNCTITAPQALFLLNSQESLDLARNWSQALLTVAGLSQSDRTDEENLAIMSTLITKAYRSAYARLPTGDELAAGKEFLRTNSVSDFCHALINSTELLYVE